MVQPLGKHPVALIHRVRHAQAAVLMQVFGPLGHAMGLQVTGRSAGDAEDGAQRHSDQLRVGQGVVHGDHHIVPFGQRVGVALGQGQLHHHLRA
ncbi:hypothetical protein D3C79_836800 [compost metagenome]